MNTALISPEYQVEIPPEIRQSLGIEPGQRVQIIQYDNRVELILCGHPSGARDAARH